MDEIVPGRNVLSIEATRWYSLGKDRKLDINQGQDVRNMAAHERHY